MNKKQIIDAIVGKLADNLDVLRKAARASHEEATHESSKAENKYDTRGLEAAYLAGGQARQAKELLDAIELYTALPVRAFRPDEPVELGALVELRSDDYASWYFIGPKNGGLEVELDGVEIMVITPQSPLGQNLAAKKQGQKWTGALAGRKSHFEILKLQ